MQVYYGKLKPMIGVFQQSSMYRSTISIISFRRVLAQIWFSWRERKVAIMTISGVSEWVISLQVTKEVSTGAALFSLSTLILMIFTVTH